MQVLQTERLSLREMESRDAPFIVELLTDPEFLANIGDRGVHDLDGAHAYIDRWRGNYVRDGFGMWLLELRETQELVGMCGIVRRDTLPSPDIGYALLPQFRSKGYAVEACSAVRDHAIRTLGMPELLAIVSPGNAASEKVLERIGLRFKDHVRVGEDDLRLFALEA